jgi:hypothetical protein
MAPEPTVVAAADKDWYDHFVRATSVEVDEVNFWQPAALRRFHAQPVGGSFFFRLKAPWQPVSWEPIGMRARRCRSSFGASA